MLPFDPSRVLRIGDPGYSEIEKQLKDFDLQTTLATVAGLLSVPEYHASTPRIEMLLHLALIHCCGERRVGHSQLAHWLEDLMAALPIRRAEDPAEDVFLSNVVGPGGNYRVFEGTWEVNDYYLQDVLDCVTRTSWATPHRALRRSAVALLTLSDAVASRAGLARWTRTGYPTPRDRFLSDSLDVAALSSRVTFTYDDCEELGVRPDDLAPFFYPIGDRKRLAREFLTSTSLERRPVVHFPGAIVLAGPAAVSPAIRHFVLDWCERAGELPAFARLLRAKQRRTLFGPLLRRIAEPPERFTGGLPTQPPGVPLGLAVDSAVCSVDTDKVAHVVLLHDDPAAVAETGIGGTADYDGETGYGIDRHLVEVAAYLLANGARSGLTLLVFGGMGRGAVFAPPELPEGWSLVAISLADLETFAWSPHASLLRVYKLHEQLGAAAAEGVQVTTSNGTLNLYAYWAHHEFRLLPREIPYPAPGTRLRIGSNFVFGLRADERVKYDRHAIAVDGRSHAAVTRLRRGSLIQELEMDAIYGAHELARAGTLAGVVEGEALTIWVDAPECRPELRQFAHDLWEASLQWIHRALPVLQATLTAPTNPLRVQLRLDESERWINHRRNVLGRAPEYPVVELAQAPMTAVVEIPFGYLALLHRPANEAERALARSVFTGILAVLSSVGMGSAAGVDELVAAALPSDDVRSLHVIESRGAADQIALERKPEPRLVQAEDENRWQRGAARRVPQSLPRRTVEAGQVACLALLDASVAVLWERIRDELRLIDAASLVGLALVNSEEIARDRNRWRRTARAVLASYGPDAVQRAGQHESDLARTNHLCRILVEMAVPTCPRAGGRGASLADLDNLLGAVAVLTKHASDRAVIDGGVSQPQLTVHPDGSIEADEEFAESVAGPYVLESFGAGFRAAADQYESALSRPPQESIEREEERLGESAFVGAFVAEYGLSPSRLIDAVAELLDMAMEAESLVPRSTRAAVEGHLLRGRGFTETETEQFFRMFALFPRERWDAAPAGFSSRDWKPWRFRRRLSLVSRPVVVLGTDPGSQVLFGVDQLGGSLSYLLENIQAGWFPVEYFRSREMRRYLGSMNDALGHAFTAKVAADLRALGWNTREEVQMRTLGASKELGDLDVVAWHEGDGRLLLIECKRLQPDRAIGEIVERLSEFRGDATDRLGKHLRRTDWVRQNIAAVRKRLGLGAFPREPLPLLVTNVEVPMRFASGMGLPPSQVLPQPLLAEKLRPRE